jgi:hypothetical protein
MGSAAPLLDRLIGQTGLLGHGLGDTAIKKGDTEPLSDSWSDNAAALRRRAWRE